jgi:hypothetical protein
MAVTMYDIETAVTRVYDMVLLLSCICAICYFRKVDKATRTLCLWILTGGITELLAWYFAMKYKNNLPVYAFYSIVELSLIAFYFAYSVKFIRRHRLHFIFIAASTLMWLVNVRWLQPLNSINSNFIFIECLITVCLSLYALYRRLLIYNHSLIKKTHFWIPCILLLYCCGTLWNWGFYDFFFKHYPDRTVILSICILGMNILTYSAFTLILLFYSKMKRSYVF